MDDEGGESGEGGEDDEDEGPAPIKQRRRRHADFRPRFREVHDPNNDVFDLVYGSGNKVLLKPLHEDLQDVVHHSFWRVEAGLYIANAFPDRRTQDKFAFLQDVLVKGAQDANKPLILKRLKTDSTWSRRLHSLVSGAIVLRALL